MCALLGRFLKTRVEQSSLKRLVERGLVQVAGVTPSDASHVLGRVDAWDGEAAEKALQLFARRRVGTGNPLAASAEAMAQMIVDQLTEQTALALLETAFAEEAEHFPMPAADLARHVLTQRGFAEPRGHSVAEGGYQCGCDWPWGLCGELLSGCWHPAECAHGSARTWRGGQCYRGCGGADHAAARWHGNVAFRGEVPGAPWRKVLRTLQTVAKRFNVWKDRLTRDARDAAEEAGAADINLHVARDIRTAQVEAREVFVEAMLTVTASGRPRVAHD